ncbi:MAG TPA: hypothetical protein VMI56_26395 [Reyranella sp.]|nr:hypothetical protein [Reyranella sp.]
MRILLTFLLLGLGAAMAQAAEPVPTPKAIFFAKGASRGTVGGHVLRGARDLYSLKAAAGQIMTINMTAPDDNAVFQIYEPGTSIARDADGLLEFRGKALHGAADGEDATRWNGRLTHSGTYIIVVGSTRGNARYSLDVTIE